MKTDSDLADQLGIPLSRLVRIANNHKQYYVYKRHYGKKGKKPRKLRVPKGALLTVQEAIKKRLLDRMPLPRTMHGWRKGHSAKTYVVPHVRKPVLVNVDIKDFFPSVKSCDVYGMWLKSGYTPAAARLLTLLTTCDNQLPQGSTTSQSVGNQVLRDLDRRLHPLARQHRISYSNYGDEVAFSGRERTARLKGLIVKIINQ